MKKALSILCLTLVVVGLIWPTAQAQTTTGTRVKLQLGFLIDGSGSISDSDFSTIRNALATVLGDETVVPRDGSIEVIVVQFSDARATVELPAMLITNSTIASLQQTIRSINQGRGGTPLWNGIDSIVSEMKKSANFSVADRRTINVATDGQPQVPVDSISFQVGQQRSLEARDKAISAGIDEIDAEGVGQAITDTNFRNFLLDFVWPQPGKLVTSDNINGNFQPGFVTLVQNFSDFEKAVRDKVVAILGTVGLNGNNGNSGNNGNGNGNGNNNGSGNNAPGPGGRPIPFDTPQGTALLGGVFAVLLAVRFWHRLHPSLKR